RAAAGGSGVPRLPRALPRQGEPRALLLGRVQSRRHALLRAGGARPPGRAEHRRPRRPGGVLARVLERGFLARWPRRRRGALRLVRVPRAPGVLALARVARRGALRPDAARIRAAL